MLVFLLERIVVKRCALLFSYLSKTRKAPIGRFSLNDGVYTRAKCYKLPNTLTPLMYQHSAYDVAKENDTHPYHPPFTCQPLVIP